MSKSTTEEPAAADDEGEPATDRERAADSAREHLEGVEDGCGCAEVWEHLSEERDAEASPD